MRRFVLLIGIMHVVCRHKLYARVFGKPEKLLVDQLLLR